MDALPLNIGWKKRLILLKKYALRKNNLIFHPKSFPIGGGFTQQPTIALCA